MYKNSNFNTSKHNKNDEFYTCVSDIEKEICNYKDELYGKSVLCNCNDGEESAFRKYLSENFMRFGLKKITAIKYCPDSAGYVLETERINGKQLVKKSALNGSGDFRSDECRNYLKHSDIVITNPPFSLFREYISLLNEHGKKYLIIGNMNELIVSDIFPLFLGNKLWLGYNSVKSFMKSDGKKVNFGNIV